MSVEGSALPSPQTSQASRKVGVVSLLDRREESHPIFRFVWYSANFLLLAFIIAAIYSAIWEYSTRRYLKGFSDAIIPVTAAPEQKIQSILDWMSTGPARSEAGPSADAPDRDPSDTLNYNSLLRVCGTATNAFINLADSGNLVARRLLLLDNRRSTKHVDAEVLVNGRWIVVDPMFRTILRGPDGNFLTREDLLNTSTLSAAAQKIRNYDLDYSFEHTSHVRLARLPIVGGAMRKTLNFLLPGWEDSSTVSLLLERESLAAMVGAILIVLVMMLLRASLRWYGENRLGMHSVRVRTQFRRAFQAFFDTAR
jgi:hypothetical protein